MPENLAAPPPSPTPRLRLEPIDAVRGLAMILMALDHMREFVSNAPFDPMDMAHTTPAYFLTRWVTHFCAPAFVFLAGVSVFLATLWSTTDITRMLVTRGLWLMLLEVAFVTPLGWAFDVDYGFTRLQVIWAIGGAMILLAPLVRFLRPAAVLVLGLAIVLLHDGLNAHAAIFGGLEPVWAALNTFQILKPAPGHVVASIYPVMPWLGIMATGYGLGGVFLEPAPRQRRILLGLGAAAVAAFILLRWTQLYGDPKPWAPQASTVLTLLSFLNCSKYPPSLLYTLMTLGPVLILLALAPRLPAVVSRPLALLGRVPLFFYLLHLPLLHAMAVAAVALKGHPVGWLFVDGITLGHTPASPGVQHGLDLAGVYGLWALGLILLYPACKAYARVKDSKRYPLLAYL